MEPNNIPQTPISILTYNLLYPQRHGQHADYRSSSIGYAWDNWNQQIVENSAERIQLAIGNILNNLTDVICLQEITPEFCTLLAKTLTQYQCLFDCHHPKSSHGIATFYNLHKITCIRCSSEKFSNRTHHVLDLAIIGTNKVVRVGNCHLIDPRGMSPIQKTDQICSILRKMKFDKAFVDIHAHVIAGDFNQDQWGDAPKVGKITRKPQNPDVGHATIFRPLIASGYWIDGDYSPSEYKRMRLGPAKRNPHDKRLYQQDALPRKRRIDYIWIRTHEPESIQSIKMQNINHLASDHAPVGSTFNL